MARHKVCFVTKEITQVEGIDFNDNFSPIAQWNQLELCLQLQPLKILRCIKWMLKLPFWMEIF